MQKLTDVKKLKETRTGLNGACRDLFLFPRTVAELWPAEEGSKVVTEGII